MSPLACQVEIIMDTVNYCCCSSGFYCFILISTSRMRAQFLLRHPYRGLLLQWKGLFCVLLFTFCNRNYWNAHRWGGEEATCECSCPQNSWLGKHLFFPPHFGSGRCGWIHSNTKLQIWTWSLNIKNLLLEVYMCSPWHVCCDLIQIFVTLNPRLRAGGGGRDGGRWSSRRCWRREPSGAVGPLSQSRGGNSRRTADLGQVPLRWPATRQNETFARVVASSGSRLSVSAADELRRAATPRRYGPARNDADVTLFPHIFSHANSGGWQINWQIIWEHSLRHFKVAGPFRDQDAVSMKFHYRTLAPDALSGYFSEDLILLHAYNAQKESLNNFLGVCILYLCH